jgi:hypothetical protein
MSVPPEILDTGRRILVGVVQFLAASALILVITGGLLAGVAYVLTAYAFNR